MPQPASSQSHFDVIIIGAGAAGLMCAATAGYQGKRVLLLDHAKQAGKKILISGGGRSNFTNMYATPENYLSQNPHFCKSALNRYTQWDFMALVDKHKIPWHEKTLGQLFCDNSAKDLVRMLLKECELADVNVKLRTEVLNVTYTNDQYALETSQGDYSSSKLVIATGGLSMPRLGATPFGYKIAEQFGHTIEPVRAGLVPFTLHDQDKEQLAELAGLSLDVVAKNKRPRSYVIYPPRFKWTSYAANLVLLVPWRNLQCEFKTWHRCTDRAAKQSQTATKVGLTRLAATVVS